MCISRTLMLGMSIFAFAFAQNAMAGVENGGDDNDTIPDRMDNCLVTFNEDQCDTDGARPVGPLLRRSGSLPVASAGGRRPAPSSYPRDATAKPARRALEIAYTAASVRRAFD